ncbi:MAG: nucleoside monophosphate kinase, partial [Candidatus Saccharibacteria bacterium]
MTISERSIILMGGKPGSGKTNLSRRLQTALDNPLDKPRRSVEHVSIGEFARQQLILGKQATRSACQTAIIDHLSGPDKLQPFDEDIARGIVYEQLLRSDAEIVLLDGYPRYFPQVDGVFELAARSDFYVKGAIITHVEENEAVRRMMKRTDDRVTSEAEAYQRLAQHEQS